MYKLLESILRQITPLIIIPYIIAALVIIPYYVFLKYTNWRKIRNFPTSTLFGVDLNKVKKNIKVKSTVYDLILFLSTYELIVIVLMTACEINKFDFKHHFKHSILISDSCAIKDRDLINFDNKSTFWVDRALSIGIVLTSLLPIILSLFLVIIRRLYINYPYFRYIRKYILYIIIQFLLKAALTCFFQTRYFEQLILFPLAVIDTSIYISSAHKFYLLLKGRMHEARIHFSKRDYLNKQSIVTQFYFAQVYTLFLFSFLVFSTFLSFISVPLDIISHNPCYLSYISLGYIPDMKLPKHIRKMFGLITHNFFYTELILAFVSEVLLVFVYVALGIFIIRKLIRRRRKFIHINDIIPPLMKRYRNDN